MKLSLLKVLGAVLTFLIAIFLLTFAILGLAINQFGLSLACVVALAIVMIFVRKDVLYFVEYFKSKK